MYAVVSILGCEVVCRNIHLSWFHHNHFNFGFHAAAVGELSASKSSVVVMGGLWQVVIVVCRLLRET
jgi:hypothetical protein